VVAGEKVVEEKLAAAKEAVVGEFKRNYTIFIFSFIIFRKIK
jgi:hypothetical protein